MENVFDEFELELPEVPFVELPLSAQNDLLWRHNKQLLSIINANSRQTKLSTAELYEKYLQYRQKVASNDKKLLIHNEFLRLHGLEDEFKKFKTDYNNKDKNIEPKINNY